MFDFSYLVRNFDATEVPVLSIAMEKNFGRRLSAKAAMEFAVQRRMQLACRTWCIFALGPLAVYVLFAVHLDSCVVRPSDADIRQHRIQTGHALVKIVHVDVNGSSRARERITAG